jgi:hypothetical protein
VGKTDIAIKHTHKYGEKYDSVIYLSVGTDSYDLDTKSPQKKAIGAEAYNLSESLNVGAGTLLTRSSAQSGQADTPWMKWITMC